jgi:ribonuclease HI
MPPPKERPEHWIMYFDGVVNLEGAGAGVLLISSEGEQLKYVLQIYYKASNNSVEYEAPIHGLHIAVSLGIKRLLAFGDSKVIMSKSTWSGTVSRTRWMLTALRFANSKATSRESSFSTSHETITWLPTYFPN